MRRTVRRGVLQEPPRRMLKLDAIIDRFVDDVLRAIRGASVNELRELFATSAAEEPTARPRRAKPSKRANKEAPAAKAARPRAKRMAKAPRRPASAPAVAPEPAPETPVMAEITDPELLLGAQEAPAQPATPEQDLNARRAQMKANFEQMSKTPLPMSVEPAVTFRA